MADLNRQLINAAADGDLDRVKLLVAQGADPAYRNELGYNAIMEASNYNRLPVVRYFLTLPGNHPANITRNTYPANISNGGNTAITYAANKWQL